MSISRLLSVIGLVATGLLGVAPAAQAAPGSWSTASVGGEHTCGIRTPSTEIECWGEGSRGQLGDYFRTDGFPWEDTDADQPRTVGNTITGPFPLAASISTGFAHTCAITSNKPGYTPGSLYCWGANGDRQLGDGTATPRYWAKRVGAAGVWTKVSAGESHTCGITEAKNLYCWGNNTNGQIGDGTSGADKTALTKIGGSGVWAAISAGAEHTCGITMAKNLYCWGDNKTGQIGDGTIDNDKLALTRIGGSGVWNSVNAGGAHTCGITEAKNLYCWGSGSTGQIGDGTVGNDRPAPTRIGGSGVWNAVSAGDGFSTFDYDHHTCGITTAKNLYCWGSNSNGQIGVGSSGNLRHSPTKIGTSGIWSGVDANGLHTCARTTNNNLWCWGKNASGQVGNNSNTDRLTPALIP